MRSRIRGGAAAAGVLAAVLLTTACHVTTQAVADPASPAGSASTGSASAGSASAGSASAGSPSAARPSQASDPASGAARSGGAATAGPVVALGDSYTAGALLPLDPNADPRGCLRSTRAYPVLVAQALHAHLTDAACTSAGVKEMSAAQKTYLGTNPAQLDALAPDDKLVMLTLGGDDIGFMNVLQECMKLSVTDLAGSPCQAHYTAGGRNQLAANVTTEASKIAGVLSAVRARAPQARVVVVGYPDLFPQSGGCWPAVPITSGDIAYLRGIEVKANAMLAATARAAGDTFVNTYAPTTGHDFCRPEATRDIEGLIPGSLALPFHPNAKGQQAMANAVLAALKSLVSGVAAGAAAQGAAARAGLGHHAGQFLREPQQRVGGTRDHVLG